MKIGTVRSSQVAEFGRMDAEFHLLVNEFRERSDELRQARTLDEVTAHIDKIFSIFSHDDLKIIGALCRGSGGHSSKDRYRKAAAEYPYLALAALESLLPSLVENAEQTLATTRSILDEIKQASARPKLRP